MRKDTRYYWRLAEALAESVFPSGLPLATHVWATQEKLGQASDVLEGLLGQPPPHYLPATLLLWRDEGYRTYSLDRPHSLALLDADPKGLSEETCRLPNAAFVLELPTDTGIGWEGASGLQRATHVLCSVHGPDKIYLQIETKDSVLVDVSNAGETPREWSTREEHGVEALFGGEAHPNIPSRAKQAIFGCRRLVANLSGMLTTKTATAEPGSAQPRARKRRHAPTERIPPAWKVSSTVVIAGPTAPPRKSSDSKPNTPSSPVASQHRVRGHWRWQACGASRKDRKLTWVRPHWRGPEDGEATAATQTPQTGDALGSNNNRSST